MPLNTEAFLQFFPQSIVTEIRPLASHQHLRSGPLQGSFQLSQLLCRIPLIMRYAIIELKKKDF